MAPSLDVRFPKGTVVAYMPGYLNENAEPVQEIGVVSSCNQWQVFVKFKRDLDHLGSWDAVTAKACKPDSLIKIIQ